MTTTTTKGIELAVERANANARLNGCGQTVWSEADTAPGRGLFVPAQLATELLAEREAHEATKERNDALALQADEWEGKYTIVSEMNERLKAKLAASDEDWAHEKGRTEAWLIEMIEPEVNRPPTPRWWHPEHGWMWEANKALRFARELDAANYIRHGKTGGSWLSGKPTPHVFLTIIAARHRPEPEVDVLVEALSVAFPDSAFLGLASAKIVRAELAKRGVIIPAGGCL